MMATVLEALSMTENVPLRGVSDRRRGDLKVPSFAYFASSVINPIVLGNLNI